MPVNIRMPEKMKEALDEIASKEFRSLNSVILQFLDEKLNDRKIFWKNAGSEPYNPGDEFSK